MAAAETKVADAADTKPKAPAKAPPRDLVLAVEMTHPELRGRTYGCALLAAHIVADLGEEEALTLPQDKLASYVGRFRSAYPTAWPAILGGDHMTLPIRLREYGVAKLDAAGYQGRTSAMLEAHEGRRRPAAAPAQARA